MRTDDRVAAEVAAMEAVAMACKAGRLRTGAWQEDELKLLIDGAKR